MKDNNLKIKNT